MTQPNYTDITVIIDRSGSMASRREETIGGFNTFIDEQRKGHGRVTVSLIQFDDSYDNVEKTDALAFQGLDINSVPKLCAAKYVPRGSTALRDAMGRTINEVGSRLAAMPEHERPATVMIVVISDGYENASREFNQERLRSMVTHQQDRYGWNFVFIGTNQDSVLTAGSYGINAGNAMNYSSNAGGTEAMYKSLSRATHEVRTSGSAGRNMNIATAAVRLSDDEEFKTANVDKLGGWTDNSTQPANQQA